MKKLVAVLMCLIVILSFSSCLNFHTPIDPESETPILAERSIRGIFGFIFQTAFGLSPHQKQDLLGRHGKASCNLISHTILPKCAQLQFVGGIRQIG